MYVPPTDVDESQLAEMVAANWNLTVATIGYEPVGFGTHHYLAVDSAGKRWFVNLDDLTADAVSPDMAFDRYVRAFGTARALRDAGLEFVQAPVVTTDGRVVARFDGRYAASVVPFLEGSSSEFGEHASDDERRAVLAALGRMHAASDRVPSELPRQETFDVPLRTQLFDALARLDDPWDRGPYGESCRRQLNEHAPSLYERFERYDALVRDLPRDGWVVTHGEPHAANVMHRPDGGLVLIDWDTAAIGPCERDLWMVEPRSDEDWDAYTSAGGIWALNDSTVEVYRLNWELTEIAIYTEVFRKTHVEDPNTVVAWRGFQEYLTGPR